MLPFCSDIFETSLHPKNVHLRRAQDNGFFLRAIHGKFLRRVLVKHIGKTTTDKINAMSPARYNRRDKSMGHSRNVTNYLCFRTEV